MNLLLFIIAPHFILLYMTQFFCECAVMHNLTCRLQDNLWFCFFPKQSIYTVLVTTSLQGKASQITVKKYSKLKTFDRDFMAVLKKATVTQTWTFMRFGSYLEIDVSQFCTMSSLNVSVQNKPER